MPARLLLVGDGPETGRGRRGSTREHRRWPSDVQFLGDQEQVVPLLSIADLFLLPSAQESFGLAALEAMACEVPVVASRVGGLPDVIEHGVTGFLHAAGRSRRRWLRPPSALLTDEALHQRMAAAAAPRPPRRASADTGLCRCTRRTTTKSSGDGAAAVRLVVSHEPTGLMPRPTSCL